MFDNMPANESFSAIIGFIKANEMRDLDGVPHTKIKRRVTEDLVKVFRAQAANISQILIQQWDLEEFSCGRPVAYSPLEFL
jgi:monoamine oxidase